MYRQTRLLSTSAGVIVLAMLAIIVADACGGSQSSSGSNRTVVVGWEKTPMDAVVYNMVNLAKTYNLTVKLQEFPRHPDVKTALVNGSIDFGTITSPDLAQNLDGGNHSVVGVAGEAFGGDYLECRKGLNVGDWPDLTNKRIRVRSFAGGIAWLKLLASLNEHDVSTSDMNYATVAGTAPDMQLVLKTNQADIVTMVDPFVAQGVIDGYAAYCALDINQSKIGGLNSMLATRADLLKKNPQLVQDVMSLYVQSLRQLATNHEVWSKVYAGYSGLTTNVAAESIRHVELTLVLPQAGITQAATFMYSQKLTKADMSSQIAPYLNYDFLSKAAGQSASDLGKQ